MVLLSDSRIELMRCTGSYQHPEKAVNNFWQVYPLHGFYLEWSMGQESPSPAADKEASPAAQTHFLAPKKIKSCSLGHFWLAALEWGLGKDAKASRMLNHSEHIWRWAASISQSSLFFITIETDLAKVPSLKVKRARRYLRLGMRSQHFDLPFKHLIHKGLLTSCNSFRGAGSTTKTGRTKNRDRNCLFAPFRTPKEKWTSPKRLLWHSSGDGDWKIKLNNNKSQEERPNEWKIPRRALPAGDSASMAIPWAHLVQKQCPLPPLQVPAWI